ncbi:hypothetical protein KI387_027739, partial [Taxus chinensis]
SSNDVGREDDVDLVLMIDVVGARTVIGSMDGIMGKDIIDVDDEVDEVDIGVESMVDMGVGTER